MPIVATEIESIHGSSHRMVFYRCQDSDGKWHNYGPVITSNPAFDPESYKDVVADKVWATLVSEEIRQVLGGD